MPVNELQQFREIAAFTAFTGTFPTVPTYEGIDVEMLTQGDTDPMFITLEIAQRGRVSANGLVYDDELVSALEAQLRESDAWRGHLGFFNNDDYPTSEIYWVGHTRVGDSTWAKGYVPPGETREDIRRKKAKGQKIGTSIFAYGNREWVDEDAGTWRITDMELISVDMVHAKRAALTTSQQFALTAESKQPKIAQQEADMPTREEIIQSLTVADLPQALRESIAREALQPVQAELTQARDQLAATESALVTANGLVQQYQQQAFNASLNAAVAACTEAWHVTTEAGKARVAQLHTMIRAAALAKLGGQLDAAQAAEAVKQAWEEHALIAESVQLAISGPPAVVASKAPATATGESVNPLEAYKSADGAKALLAKFGLVN